MTTLPASPEVLTAGSAVANDFARRLAGLGPGALHLLRQALQERLGTAAEQAGDGERARVLDREINRRRTALDHSAALIKVLGGGWSVAPATVAAR